MQPHWRHSDEEPLADRVVLLLCLLALIFVCVGLDRGWFYG